MESGKGLSVEGRINGEGDVQSRSGGRCGGRGVPGRDSALAES